MDAIKMVFAAINQAAEFVLVVARTLTKYAKAAEIDADKALKEAQNAIEE